MQVGACLVCVARHFCDCTGLEKRCASLCSGFCSLADAPSIRLCPFAMVLQYGAAREYARPHGASLLGAHASASAWVPEVLLQRAFSCVALVATEVCTRTELVVSAAMF